MLPRYDEIVLTDSAYRHGFGDEDVAEMLRRKTLIIRSRRGRLVGYEILGRNADGVYLLGAARVVEYPSGDSVLRVFHLNRMTYSERRRYKKVIGQ